MTIPPSSVRQSHDGSAMLMVLLALLVGWSLWLALQLRGQANEQASLRALLMAREALIGRAVADANRPGSLPCPDFRTQLPTNQPNDGFADLLAGTECPASVGWLPWATLDLGDLRDHSGSRLWYAMSRTLRDDDSAQPINSNTPGALRLEGSGDIAALLIAPLGALAGQQRPSLDRRDYLDGSNADGDSDFTARRSAGQNDLVLPLRRSDLMAAVERRVINDVRNCLHQHAAASGRYPWPAPLGRNDRQSRPGSLFGRLPSSQASAGQEQSKAEQLAALQHATSALASAAPGEARLPAAQALAERLHAAAAFFDQTWLAARNLFLAASNAVPAQQALRDALAATADKATLNAADQKTLLTRAAAAQATANTLLAQLQASGVDVFPSQLGVLAQALRQHATNTPALMTTVSEAERLLNLGQTNNSAIAAPLDQARQAGSFARATLQQAAGDRQVLPLALDAAARLAQQLLVLQGAITAQRLNVPAAEIDGSVRLLSALEGRARLGTGSAGLTVSRLNESLLLVNSVAPANPLVQQARDHARDLLQSALAPTPGNTSQAISAARQALSDLAQAMRNNGDNLTLSVLPPLLTAPAALLTAGSALPATTTLSTLASKSDDLAYFAALLSRHAEKLATTSRGPASRPGEDDPASLHALAGQALLSLEGTYGTLARLAQANNLPSASRRKAADDALAATAAAIDTLFVAERALTPEVFAGGAANAAAITWLGSACTFLQTGSAAPGWWAANAWDELVFVQISGPLATSAGRLRINDQAGRWPFVVIAAGGRLAGQARPGLLIADYLEAENADVSRNGDAEDPAETFTRSVLAPNFNDQLVH